MGLFGRRKVNSAVATVPPPRPLPPMPGPTVHHHGANWPGIIFALAVAGPVLAASLFFFLVMMADSMGSRDPWAEAAFWMVSVPAAVVAAWLIKWFLLGFLDRILAYRLEVLKEVNEGRRVELTLNQPALPSGRMNSEDRRFSLLVKAVMLKAFDHGPYRYGDTYPWSREQAKAEVVDGQEAGFALGTRVGPWLRQHGVIVKEGTAWQVNRRRFPTMGSIDELLYKMYDVPVSVNPSPITLRENDGYTFIE